MHMILVPVAGLESTQYFLPMLSLIITICCLLIDWRESKVDKFMLEDQIPLFP